MLRKFSAALLLLSAGAAQAAEHFDGTTWWNTVKVLADDNFEGRDPGSEGERQAQAYIVSRLKALGVARAGTIGYYQAVKLRTLEIQEADSTLALQRDRRAQPLTLGEQAFFSTRVMPAPRSKHRWSSSVTDSTSPRMATTILPGLTSRARLRSYSQVRRPKFHRP